MWGGGRCHQATEEIGAPFSAYFLRDPQAVVVRRLLIQLGGSMIHRHPSLANSVVFTGPEFFNLLKTSGVAVHLKVVDLEANWRPVPSTQVQQGEGSR